MAFFLAEGAVRFLGYRPYQPEGGISSVEPGGRLYRVHPTLGFAHLPGRFTITLAGGYRFQATHGTDGLRLTRPLESPQAAGSSKEIWIFGCSFTYGFSLNDAETFPWLLQERFPDWRVVNFGAGGYGTIQSLIQLKEALTGGRKPPAVLIVAYGSFHDMRNCGYRLWRKSLIHHAAFGEVFLPQAGLDRQGNLTYARVKLDYAPFPFMDRSAFIHRLEEAYNRREASSLEGHQVSRALLGEINRICRERQIVPVVAGLMWDKKTALVLEHCRSQGMFTVDIAVDFTRPENNLLPYDGHPNARANREYARRLGDYLQEKVLPQLAATEGK